MPPESVEPQITETKPGVLTVVEDGREIVFAHPIRTFRLNLTQCEIFEFASKEKDERRLLGVPTTRLVGSATINESDTIEVIGRSDETRTSSIKVRISSKSHEEWAEFVQTYLASPTAKRYPPPAFKMLNVHGVGCVPDVTVYWYDPEPEFRQAGGWSAEVIVSPETLTNLVTAIERGRLSSLELLIDLWNIYSDEHYNEPDSPRFPWYARPDPEKNTFSPIEPPRGVLTTIRWNGTNVVFQTPRDPPDGGMPNVSSHEVPVNDTLVALHSLTRSVRIFGLTICALLVVWFFLRH